MLKERVQKTLEKHHYHCYEDHDRQYLTSWLELLVLFRQLEINIHFVRRILEYMTRMPYADVLFYPVLELNRFEGSLVYFREKHTFTPFPKLVSTSHLYTGRALTDCNG
jgi:hypothetical protein